MQELIGQTLGQYKIVEQIGRGGMAAVFKAYQLGLERWVAVKVLPPHYAVDPHFHKHFLREARAIAQLEHPHILPVYDFGQKGPYTYLVMRYVEDSRSLVEAMRRPFPLTQMLAYLDQVAAALDYAHGRGIIHRDIKPANILLDQDWVFLADFGLARLLASPAALTITDIAGGTPAYISPEQGSGAKVDARTDIYAVGVMVYEMLTGQIPHVAEAAQAIIYRRNHEPAPSARDLRPEIPPPLDQVVQTALAPNPAQRFQSTGALVTAMRRVIQESNAGQMLTMPTSAPWAEPSPSPWSPPPPTFDGPLPVESDQPETGRDHLPWLGWLAISLAVFIVVALLTSGITWWVVRPSRADQVGETGVGAIILPSPTLTPPPPSPTSIPPTPLPPTLTPTALVQNCTRSAGEVFSGVWQDYRHLLGCPASDLHTLSTIAEETFQGGHLFWIRDTDQVYIVLDREKNGGELAEGKWKLAEPDWKWDGSNPEGVGMSPPAGLVEPKRGFGWLWRNHLGGPEGPLGWALDREYGFDNLGQAQLFERGRMFKGSGPKIYVLLDDGAFYVR